MIKMRGKRHSNGWASAVLALAAGLLITGCQLRSAQPSEHTPDGRAEIIAERIKEYSRKFEESERACTSRDAAPTDSSLSPKKVLDKLDELRARLKAVQ